MNCPSVILLSRHKPSQMTLPWNKLLCCIICEMSVEPEIIFSSVQGMTVDIGLLLYDFPIEIYITVTRERERSQQEKIN